MNNRPASLKEKNEKVKNKFDAIESFIKTSPDSLKHSKAIKAWERYSIRIASIHPSEHTGPIIGVIYHIDTHRGGSEEASYFAALKIMLEDYKKEFDDEYVHALMNEIPQPVYQAGPHKDEKELLREHLEGLKKERQQAEKSGDKREAARLGTLISQCELCLFRKPVKDREIDAQHKLTATFYYKSIMGDLS